MELFYLSQMEINLFCWCSSVKTKSFFFLFFFFLQGRGERAYDIYSRLLRERIICVMGPVSIFLGVGAH